MLSLVAVRRWIKSREALFSLLSIILLGGLLRIYDLGSESIWLDEAASIELSVQNIALVVEGAGPTQNHPPLYFVVLHFWMNLFGTSEVATRSLSAMFGIISIPLIYQVGSILFNRKVGLISGLLSAISFYHIYYSQEVRGYSLLLLLSLLSYLLFVKILNQGKKWYYPCYFSANLFLGYTHVFGLFIVASQIFYFVLFWNKYKEQRTRLLVTQAIIAIGFLPLVILLGQQVVSLAQGNLWIPEPSLFTIGRTFAVYAGYGGGRIILLLSFFLLGLIGLFSIQGKGEKWTLKRPFGSLKDVGHNIRLESIEKVLLLVIWLSFPIVIPFMISQVTTPIYTSTYTIGASPAFYLLVAKGMDTFIKKRTLYAILIFITFFSMFGLQSYYTHEVKEQWRETASFIELNSKGNEVIIFCQRNCQTPFDYYYRGDLQRFEITRNVGETQEVATFVDNAARGKERLWLVLRHADQAPPIRSYLIDKYGSRSIIMETEFVGVLVLLVDLSVPILSRGHV